MATISPVIGAPNSFTAIDEAFVTTEIVEPETNNNEQMQKPTYISTAIPEDTVFEKVTVTEPNASGKSHILSVLFIFLISLDSIL
jgi:hypothetical protein